MASAPSRFLISRCLLPFALLAGLFAAEQQLRPLDTKLYRFAARSLAMPNAETLLLLEPGESVPMQKQQQEKRWIDCPEVGILSVDDAHAAACFAALPLQAQDLAVLLKQLQRAHVETVGLSSPLIWEDEPGAMAQELFCRVLAAFPQSAVGLRGRSAATADFTPIMLRDSAIPAENISGDSSGLPVANKALPNGMSGSPDALAVTWAPDWLEDEPLTHRAPALSQVSFPLLVRWNGETIPTLPLRLAMAKLGLKASDLRVKLGQELRLGKRVLPLDAHGRCPLTQARYKELSMEGLMNGQDIGCSCAMLEQSMQEHGDSARLSLLARTLSECAGVEHSRMEEVELPVSKFILRRTEEPAGLRRWLLPAGLGLAALYILPFLPAFLRRTAYLALPLALLGYAYWLMRGGLFFCLSGQLAALILLLFAVLLLVPKQRDRLFKHSRR